MRAARRVASSSCRVVLPAASVLAGTSGFSAEAAAAPAIDPPLIEAARAADPVAVRALLRQQADVHAAEADGTTALQWAAYKSDAETARLLLRAGARVDARNRYHVTPLELAAGRGAAPVVEVLLGAGADPNSTRPEGEPVDMLDPVDTLAFARFLLERGADPNARKTARFNNRERNNLNRVGATPYLLAAKHADVPLMRLLAERGADTRLPTTGNASPLMVAAGAGIFNVGESAGTNAEAFDAVRLASELGDRDVNRADDRGYTALHGAALRGANPIVEFLAERGADLLAESGEGWTPLRVADGVHYTGTVKRADHTAALLRRIMQEQGVYAAEHERDVNGVAVVKPAGR